ncbi:uncharacterized protein LOC105428524 [Pogonomyrmex barbatus]|uniref:Uncharacterized protein LOC105428524 n=1 Tax=Pogonomyrmex barbatus TaxID=144034 RepID=A0A6I9X470_9HYME|nr:uncharacterized protein LOC105428524 [Pogonomyrmex barbatus]
MRFARIYIVAFLLVHALCNAETAGNREIKVNDSDNIERRPVIEDAADVEDADSGSEEEKEQENVEEVLPILPPIILLDFDNGTIDNATGIDEKSKRTVNNDFGYGFDRNSLLTPRKYNYYFPAGKTGTTVSIEESISPFLPRTIIEKIPSSSQKLISNSFADLGQHGSYRARGSTGSHPTSYQYYNSMTKSSPVFGLRTKLMKTSDSEPYQGFLPITRPSVEAYSNVDYQEGRYASTTPQSLEFSATETATAGGFVTPSPQSYTASSSSRYTYVTPSPPSYIQRYLGQSSQHVANVQSYPRQAHSAVKSSTSQPLEAAALVADQPNYTRSGSNHAVESSTSGSDEVPGYSENTGQFANLPRYTVENGVKYENKIFWKYPDGRVSDVPPMTYETYSEYPSLAALQAARNQDSSQTYESVSTENSVLSQGPVQFPMAPEPTGSRTPFISANSLSRLQQQQQAFRLGYQNFIGQKQAISQQTKASSGVSPTYSVSSTTLSPRNSLKLNGKNPKNRYETLSRQPISKYMINSPNPEYFNNPKPTRPFVPSAGGNSAKKMAAGNKNLDGYSNLQYSDLLNYNPSISQYIKNPASILNVQPTFVQAGNSLIPVIILRVDGVPPIQPKATPNVNLKALLQQYLIQYAKSIEELARQSNYDLGDDQSSKDQHSFSTSPLHELTRLASNGGTRDLLGNPTESYIGKSSYETSNLDIEKDPSSGRYGERTATRPKVKSVQIIEDPRLANHRI